MRKQRFRIAMLAFISFMLTINCATDCRTLVDAAQSESTEESTHFAQLRDALTNKILTFEPEELRMLGGSEVAGHLKDWSPRAINEQVALCREGLKQLKVVEVSNATERLDREVLSAHLTYLEYYYGQYHGELGNLQISAYPYDVIQYELQRFATNKRDVTSARDHFGAIEGILRRLPSHLKQQQSNLTAGLKLRQPDREILAVLIKRIGSQDIQDSIRGGLKQIAEDLESPKIQSVLSASQREVLLHLLQTADMAYARHANFLKTKLMPRAKDSWSLGKDEYKRRFSLVYGDQVVLDQLVTEAQTELQRVRETMVSLAHELRPKLSLTQTLEELRKKHAATEQELLTAYEQVQKKIDDGMTKRLGLPVGAARYLSAPLGVSVSPATNWPAPLLSPGPGIVLVDTSPSGLIDNALVDLSWIAAHEGNPGHAAQSLLFQSAFKEGRTPLCRFLNVPDEVGYVRGNWYAMANIEGWAFYTERLLLASGLLTSEERLAALTGQALRAARVVADVRMHTGVWSRIDAAAYLERNAGISANAAKGQAYRYSGIPLQAVSYYLGARQFEELYKTYHARYGDDFYRQSLSLGPVPPRLIGEYLSSRQN
ncbi:MAG TPA: DUF885 domain-containing protein [Pyrinomonadaceae bacterium]|nr:DUF885 domain-containing protein [Pyrinomonadaceae bacterium]